MFFYFNISDTAAQHFGDTPEAIGRNLLLKAALEDYREGHISEDRFAQILGVSRREAQEILDQHSARRPSSSETQSKPWPNKQAWLRKLARLRESTATGKTSSTTEEILDELRAERG